MFEVVWQTCAAWQNDIPTSNKCQTTLLCLSIDSKNETEREREAREREREVYAYVVFI